MNSDKNSKYNENDFDLEEVKRFDANFAIVRDIGQALMFAIVILGLAGVFGYGTWTKKKVAISSESTLEYEHFLRTKKKTPLNIYLHNAAVDSAAFISIHNDYLIKIDIDHVTPQPENVYMRGDSLVFEFNSTAGSSGLIRFTTEAQKSGNVELRLSVNGAPTSVKQFIYP